MGVRCTARSKRSGEQCKGWAVPGKAVCYQHGGAPRTGRPPVHGRYSQALAKHPSVLERYERHKSDPAMMETLNEIALLRAKLDHYLDSYAAMNDPISIANIRGYVESIGRAVERRHKLLYGEQITITERDFEAKLIAVLDTVKRIYGDDERYARFIGELKRIRMAASA